MQVFRVFFLKVYRILCSKNPMYRFDLNRNVPNPSVQLICDFIKWYGDREDESKSWLIAQNFYLPEQKKARYRIPGSETF